MARIKRQNVVLCGTCINTPRGSRRQGTIFYYYTIKDIKMQFEPGGKKSWVCDVFCRPVPPFLCNSEKERKI